MRTPIDQLTKSVALEHELMPSVRELLKEVPAGSYDIWVMVISEYFWDLECTCCGLPLAIVAPSDDFEVNTVRLSYSLGDLEHSVSPPGGLGSVLDV